MTRRELWGIIPGAFLLQAAAKQEPKQETKQETTLASASYPFAQMKLRTSKNGAQFRSILRGKTPTGETLEVHETTLPPGVAPHPPHHHAHSEMWLVRRCTLEFTVNGTKHRIGPGSAGFAASNDEHGVRNPGATPVTYFVVEVGATAGA